MPRHFDSALPQIGSDKLKPMAKFWGGDTKMRKDECIACISAALKDPPKIRAALENLQPWERNALALVKRMGGVISSTTLNIGILASGLHPPRKDQYHDNWTDKLFRQGLIMGMDAHNPEYFSENYGRSGTLYIDDRILAHVGLPEYKTFNLQPMPAPAASHFRRPSAVTLDVVGFLQAIENLGGLKLNQNDSVRAGDEAKLRKALRWGEDSIKVDGFTFPAPTKAWIVACRAANLLRNNQDDCLTISESLDQFALRPYGEQVSRLVDGFIRATDWWETGNNSTYFDSYGKARQQGRFALTLALASLPFKPDAFFSFADFELALYQRIGEDFALDYPPQRPYSFRSESLQEQQRRLVIWQEENRADWCKQEAHWFVSALTTWLYFLGLVELALDNDQGSGFRLTELGWATFRPDLAAAPILDTLPQFADKPAWVVQPNFDIIAYLDQVSAPQLAFLERHAERTQSHRHTAHYQITRASVYRGLESGTTLDALLTGLQAGSQVELPQNVVVELREWAALRERLSIRRSARLIEFPSAAALQAGLSQGLVGSIHAERFLLLDAHASISIADLSSINYAQTLPPNLSVTEKGTIHLKRGAHDLMTAAQLSQWALQTDASTWQLTAESVSAALRPGRKINDLLTLLKSRSAHGKLPLLIETALRSWANERFAVELETVIVLHCTQEQVFQAVITSSLLKPLLKGYLSPNLVFVHPDQLETLRQHLNWLGWDVSDQLQIIPISPI